MLKHIFEGNSTKVFNAKEVYNTIRKYSSITKKDLQEVLKMPLTSLNRAIEVLMSIGLIEEGGICKSNMGRKPIFLKIKSNSFYLIGVEISRTSIKIVFTDMSLNIVNKVCFDINEKIEPSTLIKSIIDAIKSGLNLLRIKLDKILGIGVGTVGVLNTEKGEVLEVEGFSDLGWKNFPIKQAIEKELDILTVLNDGANAAVLAEYWSDIGKKHLNMVYLSVGVGFRCGIISHGLLTNNRKHISNDVYGHIVVSANGKPCYCGNQGCVERYVTIPAIVQSYREVISCKDSNSELEQEQITWKKICESIKSGEKSGLNVITEAAFYMSTGLVNIINAINPDAVVIGGAAINTCGILYDFAVSLAKEKLKNINGAISFYKGTYGEDEIAVGAATLILDYYLGKKVSEIVLDSALGL